MFEVNVKNMPEEHRKCGRGGTQLRFGVLMCMKFSLPVTNDKTCLLILSGYHHAWTYPCSFVSDMYNNDPRYSLAVLNLEIDLKLPKISSYCDFFTPKAAKGDVGTISM